VVFSLLFRFFSYYYYSFPEIAIEIVSECPPAPATGAAATAQSLSAALFLAIAPYGTTLDVMAASALQDAK